MADVPGIAMLKVLNTSRALHTACPADWALAGAGNASAAAVRIAARCEVFISCSFLRRRGASLLRVAATVPGAGSPNLGRTWGFGAERDLHGALTLRLASWGRESRRIPAALDCAP